MIRLFYFIAFAFLQLQLFAEPNVFENSYLRRNILYGGEDVSAEDSLANSVVSIDSAVRLNIVNQDTQKIESVTKYVHCTGVLLLQRFVITAGHCLDLVDPKTPNDIEVRFQYFSGTSQARLKAQKFKLHENFKVTRRPENPLEILSAKNDIALIMLETEAPLEYIPVAINTNKDLLTGDTFDGLVAGYGHQVSKSDPTPVLKKGPTYFSVVKAGNRRVAIGGGDAHLEEGDSGGGLFTVDPTTESVFLVGIASSYCCSVYAFGTFEYVPDFEIWLNKNASQMLKDAKENI